MTLKHITAVAGFAAMTGAAFAATPATAADMTCFVPSGLGIQCLTADGTWKNYSKKTGLATDRIQEIKNCGGKLHAVGSRAVHVLNGDEWTINQLPKGWGYRLACGPNGTYATSSSSGISHWNGSGWKVYESKQILAAEKHKTINDVVIGKDGAIWFVGFGGVAGKINKDGTVKIWKQGQGFQSRQVFSRIVKDKDGRILIPTFRGFFTPDGDGWKQLAGRAYGDYNLAADGSLWGGSGKRINQFKDGAWREVATKWSVYGVAADTGGRVWAATEFGLGVMKGGKWEFRQMHNSDILENNIRQVAVLGKGGALPAAKKQANGGLRGRLEWRKSGDPIANVEVQICGISRGLFSKSPCADQPLSYKTKTDEDGKFEFKDVQPSSYRVAIKPGTKWVRFLMGYGRARVTPGKRKSTGTLRVSDRFKK